jgi:hypothetical protein
LLHFPRPVLLPELTSSSSFPLTQDHFLRWVITARKSKKAREYKQCLQWACEEVQGMMERAESEAAAGSSSGQAKL